MRCLSHLLHAATAATLNKIKAGLQAGWEQTAVMRVKRSIQGEGERRGKGEGWGENELQVKTERWDG